MPKAEYHLNRMINRMILCLKMYLGFALIRRGQVTDTDNFSKRRAYYLQFPTGGTMLCHAGPPPEEAPWLVKRQGVWGVVGWALFGFL